MPVRFESSAPSGSNDETDEQLMLAFKAGEVRAFEALLRRHKDGVFNFILRMTGDRTRAEDVSQEAWMRVVRGAAEYQPKARFVSWLYTLVRNLCVDGVRKDSYRRADSLDAPPPSSPDGPALGEALPGKGADPEHAAYNARLRPLLEAALLALPEEQREVFILREYSGVPFKEIAALMATSENTVKSRMRYALEGLRRRLAASGVSGAFTEPERTVAK